MILTHGGNSIIRDDSEFVVLYNGISNRGLPITSGSFGTVLRDTSGPLIAPDGLGMPYFNRRNFSSGGAVSLHDELKPVFNSKNWTVEYWLRMGGGHSNTSQKQIIVIGNASDVHIMDSGEGYYHSPYMEAYTNFIRNPPYNYDSWCHFAYVSDNASGKCSFYVNGTFFGAVNTGNITDANKIIFWNYYDSEQVSSSLYCYIAQFAVRDYPVWTTNFTPPTQMY